MRAHMFIAAVLIAVATPSLTEAGNAKSVSPYAQHSMEDMKQYKKCRDEIRYLWESIGPMSGSLLKRDSMLNHQGTMNTADVQHIRLHIRDKYQATRYKMLSAYDADVCRRLADELEEYVYNYINKHVY